MYLFFRLIRISLLSRFKKPCNFFEESTVSFITWPTDLDIFLHMNNGRYFSLLDLARFDGMIRSGMASILREKKCYPVVTGETIQFKKSLKLFDKFTIKTKLLGWDEKSFYIQHIYLCKNQIYALGIIKGQILKKCGGKITPSEFLNYAGYKNSSPVLPSWILNWSQHQKEALIAADKNNL